MTKSNSICPHLIKLQGAPREPCAKRQREAPGRPATGWQQGLPKRWMQLWLMARFLFVGMRSDDQQVFTLCLSRQCPRPPGGCSMLPVGGSRREVQLRCPGIDNDILRGRRTRRSSPAPAPMIDLSSQLPRVAKARVPGRRTRLGTRACRGTGVRHTAANRNPPCCGATRPPRARGNGALESALFLAQPASPAASVSQQKQSGTFTEQYVLVGRQVPLPWTPVRIVKSDISVPPRLTELKRNAARQRELDLHCTTACAGFDGALRISCPMSCGCHLSRRDERHVRCREQGAATCDGNR